MDNYNQSSGGFLSQPLYSSMTGFLFRNHNFLIELTDEIIQSLSSGGIMQHFFEKSYDLSVRDIYSHRRNENRPVNSLTFTFDDLSYGFILWFCACIISIVVFFSELTIFYFHVSAFAYCLKKVYLAAFWICIGMFRLLSLFVQIIFRFVDFFFIKFFRMIFA